MIPNRSLFRLTTNLYVPNASEAYELVCRSKENSNHEYNWLMNDISTAIDSQANAGFTYLYYEFQQWVSEANFYTSCSSYAPGELMKRWADIVDIFYNIVETLRGLDFQLYFIDNNPSFLVIGWDVHHRVGDLLSQRRPSRAHDNNALDDNYNPSYELGDSTSLPAVPSTADGIARRLQNLAEGALDPRLDPLSDQYKT